MDPTLGDNYDQQEMACVLFTATICVEQNPIRRPHMSQASNYLVEIHILFSILCVNYLSKVAQS